MRYSSFCERIGGEGSDAWDTHMRALADQAAGQQVDGHDVIVMSVGDPDMDTPAAVAEAAIKALHASDTHYVDVMGKQALRQAIADYHNQTSVAPVDADDVVVFSGAQNALYATLMCLVEAGDEVILLEPAYVTYAASVTGTGASVVPVSQSAQQGFRPDINAIKQAITPATRVILLASPNNPTGVVLRHEELAEIAALAREHDLWIITDDVYRELVYADGYVSMASMLDINERLVTLGSLSKSHAMTGWRIGWAIAPPQLVAHYYKICLTMLYGLPGFVQEGALVALTSAWGQRLTMRATYQRRRDMTLALLANFENIRPLPCAGGMFMMVDIRGTGLSSQTFVERLYEQQGVSVMSASAFGACAEGWIRISFALDDEQLRQGIQRIGAFCKSLAEKG